ncbi:endonuclease/exonuclease/phosphatase family protein [Chengkuizengella axinellae]|uniref:Endonuclease/exonuclease/phosphatase family protein n=1 Tax=Chengkuizengella axinellae TaxID=3064388 RepID=A0ABT9J6M1_9BACL|nr:endonuclease/exonuclease/phosphatase family protein [Chengkuizengella sp. 2205SS18-9]MDP5276645.1 endonuclease/exonuclease/phosphatase family protein [Chengkuizengella sp. 2205SS18-9]
MKFITFCKRFLYIVFIVLFTSSFSYPSVQNNITIGSDHLKKVVSVLSEDITELTMMTYNIRHAKGLDGRVDLKRILEIVEESAADIIGLQEVDRFHIRSDMQDQIQELAEALNMYWAFVPSLQFSFMEYGNAILSRYPILSTDMIYLAGNIEDRSAILVEVETPMGLIEIINLHLGLTYEEKESQMMQLMLHIQEKENPIVLMGDFNMTYDHELMQVVTETWQSSRTDSATIISGLEIDYIFTNNGLLMTESWTIPSEASDHLPVVAEVSMTEMY